MLTFPTIPARDTIGIYSGGFSIPTQVTSLSGNAILFNGVAITYNGVPIQYN
jgi:hypothetical protein